MKLVLRWKRPSSFQAIFQERRKKKPSSDLLSQSPILSICRSGKIHKRKGTDPITLMRFGAAYSKAGAPGQSSTSIRRGIRDNPKPVKQRFPRAIAVGDLRKTMRKPPIRQQSTRTGASGRRWTATAGRIAYQAAACHGHIVFAGK